MKKLKRPSLVKKLGSSQELPPPENGVREHLRLWRGHDDSILVSLRAFLCEAAYDGTGRPIDFDPGDWGIVLHDIAKHIARSLADSEHPEGEILERIEEIFIAEMNNPTDAAEGVNFAGVNIPYTGKNLVRDPQ